MTAATYIRHKNIDLRRGWIMLACTLEFLEYIIPAALVLLLLHRFCKIPSHVFRKLLHAAAFTCLVEMMWAAKEWYHASLTALLFAAAVYPILCALENQPWFAGLFVQKGPGEVKKSLLLLFIMDAALVAVCWGGFGQPWVAAAFILIRYFGQKEKRGTENVEKDRQNKREALMAEAPIPGLILKMAIPTIVAFLINSIYSLTDTYFVHFLGTNATAAVSVNASLDQLIMMAGSMLAVGAASYSSRLLGARDGEKASQVLSTSFFGAFSFGLVVGVLGLIFTRPLVYLLGATPTCETFAIQYADYVLLVAPFMACNFVMNQCLRAEGSALFSMFGMGFGGILNCVLDPIFIFQFDMGVAGASLATAISKLVSFAILIFPYLTRRSVLHLSIRNVRIVKDILYQVVSVGSSSMFRSGLAVVSAIILNNIAGDISDSVLAGVGVSTKIMMFPFGIILGFGTGFQPVAGFNWGAKRYDRVRESFRFATKASIAIGLAIGVVLALGADWVISLFAETDPEMVAVGALCVRLQCLVMPIHGWVAVANMFCAGLGDARGALILSSTRQGTCFIPVVYPLSWAFGATGVASVQAVADVLSLVLAIPIVRGVLRKVTQAEVVLAAEQTAAG